MKEKLKITEEIGNQLLVLLGLEAKVTAAEDKENQAIQVQIETTEAGVLIGYHGGTIGALQLLLGIMINRRLKEWTRVFVNVGDYRQKREETLKRMALNAAQRAHFSGKPVTLEALTPSERRIVHLALQDHGEVETYSEGEGSARRLVVKPRSSE